jgi:hypothetical protein
MKRSKLNSMLAALIVLAGVATAAFAVSAKPATTSKTTNVNQAEASPEVKPEQDFTNYYWYDATMTYLNRQNTITAEMNLTGFDESLSNPKTLQEYGFAPSGVQPTPYPPTPLNPGSPNKRLWSHP